MGTLLFPENAIVITRGSSKTLELTVTDEKGKLADLTGARVYFTVKVGPLDERPLFQKVSTDTAQAEITLPREGKARIYIVPADTQYLDPHEYVFDVWVVYPSGKRYQVVKSSVFEVQPGVGYIPL